MAETKRREKAEMLILVAVLGGIALTALLWPKREPMNVVTIPSWCPYKFKIPAAWKYDDKDNWVGRFTPPGKDGHKAQLRFTWASIEPGRERMDSLLAMQSAACTSSPLAGGKTTDGRSVNLVSATCRNLERDPGSENHGKPIGNEWHAVFGYVDDRRVVNSIYIKSESRDVAKYEDFLRGLFRTYEGVDTCEI